MSFYLQHIGASLHNYPNLKRWYELCSTDVKAFKENDEGEKLFGERIRTLLDDKF